MSWKNFPHRKVMEKLQGVTFFVKDTKDIQTIALESGQTQVEISKKDAAGGTFLSGAKLKVLDENGDEKDSWTTEDKPHRISGLDAGNYFLIEETAPSRYARAASVAFPCNRQPGGTAGRNPWTANESRDPPYGCGQKEPASGS